MSVVSMFAAAFLQVSGALTRSLAGDVENTRAFYLAEGGLSEAYQGLRIGKSGQIGSAASPARAGQGLVWVDATELADGRVRLESTGMCGSGRSTLALVVEPVEISLGFFSDEDLVIDDVLLVDGYDSEEASYDDTVLEYEQSSAGDYSAKIAALEADKAALVTERDYAVMKRDYAVDAQLDMEIDSDEYLAPQNPDLNYINSYTADLDGKIAAIDAAIAQYVEQGSQSIEGLSEAALTALQEEASAGTVDHTFDGAVVGSNGSITLAGSGTDAPKLFGDAIPGVGAEVFTNGDAFATGETAARTEAIELPAVEIPTVDTLAAVVHDSAIPMLIPPSSIGYAGITVAADAELIVRGPCTLVVGTLELEPGADIYLDTTDGDVQLYVTAGMNLAPGSTLNTSSEQPEEISIQVGEIAAPVGDPAVKLESTAQFHGTIYAPNTAVSVGSAFEIFGGMAAQSLEFAPGVKLHFDSAGYEGSPLPKLVSWKIVEIPAVAKHRGDPFRELGFEPEDCKVLADAHDLAGVELSVSYLDLSGTVRGYEGPEVDFDWRLVAEVIRTERDRGDQQSDLQSDQPGDAQDPPAAPAGVRSTVSDTLDAGYSKDAMTALLIDLSPLSPEEMDIAEPILGPAHYRELERAQ
ncbi:MAG: hypothetical protein GY711_13375 [bacterium]|nr:hypothetical protein [bacterium]